ncbi:MAG: PstS family phosphate ABC transporter substrate-binding protein [Fimbriimonadaceae bacterium]|jgi:phosphate transport system substrate-binding protein|nr:PstS family phosphate ABC transporter substrate-binding protein [Fimbriimonadaceae bacterium]
MTILKVTLAAMGACALALSLVGCGSGEQASSGATTPGSAGKTEQGASGTVVIDGSGTVFPIADALKEVYGEANPGARFTVSKAGTGAGFQKLAAGEIDIATASRPIKPDEIEKLKAANIEFIEIPIAYDALTMVVPKSNTWMTQVTLEELKVMWEKGTTALTWNQVNPAWPNAPIKLYGPTEAHGTYDYFNEVVVGKNDNVRSEPEIVSRQAEYEPLIKALGRDANAFGFIGFAYMKMAQNTRAVPVVANGKPVTPSEQTILDGTYTPFSRPLLLYINKKSLETKPAVKSFVEFILNPDANNEPIRLTNYVPLPNDSYKLALDHVNAMKTGSFMQNFKPGMTFADVIKQSAAN